MRILFFTDPHFRAARPVSRLDSDFLASLLAKVDWLRGLANNVDLVLCGGDFFDRPDTPHSVVIAVNRALDGFPVPVMTVVGNHDIFGYQGMTVDATALGSLFEMNNVVKLRTVDIMGVRIHGLNAYDKTSWMVDSGPGINILVAHKLLTTVKIPGADCYLVDQVAAETNADVVLSGDIHFPHAILTNRKLFINPGSMTRLSIDDRDRTPQAAIIEILDGRVEYRIEKYQSKPPAELFDLEAYADRVGNAERMDDFVKKYINDVVSVKHGIVRVSDQFSAFLDAKGVRGALREVAVGYMGMAEKDVLQETKE